MMDQVKIEAKLMLMAKLNSKHMCLYVHIGMLCV